MMSLHEPDGIYLLLLGNTSRNQAVKPSLDRILGTPSHSGHVCHIQNAVKAESRGEGRNCSRLVEFLCPGTVTVVF